jgi:hypothetical protein
LRNEPVASLAALPALAVVALLTNRRTTLGQRSARLLARLFNMLARRTGKIRRLLTARLQPEADKAAR